MVHFKHLYSINSFPTILNMYDLPIGKDMDGKVALDIFKEINPPKFIDTWETVKGDFAELEVNKEDGVLDDEQTMKQLIELGYIEKPDDNIETSILKVKCDLKHNLARVYIGKQDYQNAKSILLELIPLMLSQRSPKGGMPMLELEGFAMGMI